MPYVDVKMIIVTGTHQFALLDDAQTGYMEVMFSNSNEDNSYHVLPFFAAGYGVLESVFDTLLCQSYFNPYTYLIATALLGVTPFVGGERTTEYNGELFRILCEGGRSR